MLRDLLFAWGWREANWGAWLAALAPNVAYQELLIQRRPTLPHGTTVIDLALASSGAELAPVLEGHFALLLGIRELLEEIPATRLPLRPYPNIEQEQRFNIENEEIRSIYHGEGLASANERMRQGIHGYYGQSHRNWLESGAPPPPAGWTIVSTPATGPIAPQSEHRPWWKLW